MRQVHISGFGTIADADYINFPAGTVPVADLPYIHQAQLYASYPCSASVVLYGNDLESYAFIYADGSLTVTSSIVYDESGDVDAGKVGPVWTDFGYDAFFIGAPIELTCDMTWMAAAAVDTGTTTPAAARISTAASVASIKAKIASKTAKVPHRTPGPVPSRSVGGAGPTPTPTRPRPTTR